MRSSLSLLVLLALPPLASADVSSPGYSRVPHHFVIEVQSAYPGYRFWLVSRRGAEPLELAPGRPCRIDGADRNGSHRLGRVVAAPAETADRVTAKELAEAVSSGKRLPGALCAEELDFHGAVPFYDSRDEIIDRYQLELVPGERLRLVLLERSAGARWVKASWLLSGLFAAVGAVWLGYRLLRRTVALAK